MEGFVITEHSKFLEMLKTGMTHKDAFLVCKNVMRQERGGLDCLYVESYPELTINGNFSWDISPEGTEYWSGRCTVYADQRRAAATEEGDEL